MNPFSIKCGHYLHPDIVYITRHQLVLFQQRHYNCELHYEISQALIVNVNKGYKVQINTDEKQKNYVFGCIKIHNNLTMSRQACTGGLGKNNSRLC